MRLRSRPAFRVTLQSYDATAASAPHSASLVIAQSERTGVVPRAKGRHLSARWLHEGTGRAHQTASNVMRSGTRSREPFW